MVKAPSKLGGEGDSLSLIQNSCKTLCNRHSVKKGEVVGTTEALFFKADSRSQVFLS